MFCKQQLLHNPNIFTVLVTKDKDKLQNINDAVKLFEEWLQNFEKLNLSKENRPYLPLATVKTLLPLKKQYKIDDDQANAFYEAYKSVGGDYKNLRTVASGDDKPTWDIVRNTVLRKLLKKIDDDKPDLWKDDLPTKEHVELIVWAYSPDASKIKKNLSKLEEKLGKADEDSDKDKKDSSPEPEKKASKRKSDGNNSSSSSKSSSGGSSDEESPKKKKKS